MADLAKYIVLLRGRLIDIHVSNKCKITSHKVGNITWKTFGYHQYKILLLVCSNFLFAFKWSLNIKNNFVSVLSHAIRPNIHFLVCLNSILQSKLQLEFSRESHTQRASFSGDCFTRFTGRY